MTTSTTTVAARVDQLKRLAAADPQAAQDAVWGWFQRVGAQLPDPAAKAELDELFKTSTPATGVDGQTEGLLVGWVARDTALNRGGKGLHSAAKAVTIGLGVLPWLGKRFDAQTKRGTNSLSRLGLLARPIAKVRKAGDHYEAFPMTNWVEPGKLDPDTEVLVIDYASLPDNPWPVSRIRDELVEIVPNTYLGKMLWHQGDDYYLLAFFALKTPVT
ncbi:MAG TPA: hypothetical protein VHI10_04120 [Mycobacterium sp.]|nr:hypothetical protein [Mycobacterium sp.]